MTKKEIKRRKDLQVKARQSGKLLDPPVDFLTNARMPSSQKIKKAKPKPVTDADLQMTSLDAIKEKCWGPKGSKKRVAAEKRIAVLGKTLVGRNNAKEASEIKGKKNERYFVLSEYSMGKKHQMSITFPNLKHKIKDPIMDLTKNNIWVHEFKKGQLRVTIYKPNSLTEVSVFTLPKTEMISVIDALLTLSVAQTNNN